MTFCPTPNKCSAVKPILSIWCRNREINNSSLTSSSLSLWSLSFSSISLSSSCSLSNEDLRGPHRRVYSTMAIVYCTRVAQSSLEYLAAAIVIPLLPSGEGVLLMALKLTSVSRSWIFKVYAFQFFKSLQHYSPFIFIVQKRKSCVKRS